MCSTKRRTLPVVCIEHNRQLWLYYWFIRVFAFVGSNIMDKRLLHSYAAYTNQHVCTRNQQKKSTKGPKWQIANDTEKTFLFPANSSNFLISLCVSLSLSLSLPMCVCVNEIWFDTLFFLFLSRRAGRWRGPVCFCGLCATGGARSVAIVRQYIIAVWERKPNYFVCQKCIIWK